ncbi:AP2/ERF and B3 domain-containing transcription factor family [Quillaja saponaria]|uniref:AP2/ERF and B3 domain-containing transcription factor family n=1 Tax=Quillaja saponaria TaxID=32244 RepID=A0AAD7QCI7_QUISA|nr:AP2/ERF and B3 domain-containing transcription factor family [Quillaja saponaria]
MNANGETSDSNDDNNYKILRGSNCKRTKHDHHDNTIAGLARLKGVVPQQNGHWGAQIYANHRRIWLGTFKSEREAAMAYDSAAVKLRSGDNIAHRNFPWDKQTVQEPKFQSHYTTESVLNMIRDGSYPSKFAAFLRTQQSDQGEDASMSLKQVMVNGDENFSCSQLFQKELTPSDVGKLNRLVIPKKHAVRYFPYINYINVEENGPTNMDGCDHGGVDIEIVFYDKLMRIWKFRYCYWRSSQSFVFTRGWNRFVKDKKLRAKDVIAFYGCECTERGKENKSYCLIDVIYNRDIDQSWHYFHNRHGMKEELDLNLGKIFSYKNNVDDDHVVEENKKEIKNIGKEVSSGLDVTDHEEKGLTLFGVRINCSPAHFT